MRKLNPINTLSSCFGKLRATGLSGSPQIIKGGEDV
jgi:hypothetical protein